VPAGATTGGAFTFVAAAGNLKLPGTGIDVTLIRRSGTSVAV
jgi:hypothetical protein